MQLVVESRQVSLPSHRPTGARHWLGRWIWAETREGRKNHRVFIASYSTIGIIFNIPLRLIDGL